MSALVVRCSSVDCSLCVVVEVVLLPLFDMCCEASQPDIDSDIHLLDVHSFDTVVAVVVVAVEHTPILSGGHHQIH